MCVLRSASAVAHLCRSCWRALMTDDSFLRRGVQCALLFAWGVHAPQTAPTLREQSHCISPSLESPAPPGVWQNGSRAPALATLPGTEKLYAGMRSLFEYPAATHTADLITQRGVRRGTQVWTALARPCAVHLPMTDIRLHRSPTGCCARLDIFPISN